MKLYCGDCDESFEIHAGTVKKVTNIVYAECPWCKARETLYDEEAD
ncbi:hypothetical protein [Aneurinibacillus aneurinilyticus]|nr:hypothetical protein [Aneurinibacillus aneurinilyticus]